jgi:hypothetical protein
MGQTETLDMVNGMPCASAARAACTSPAAVHAGQAHGRQRHGNGEFLAEQLDAGVELAHVLEHALAQRHGQVVDVAAQRLLGIGAAVDVVEQKGGRRFCAAAR